MNKSHSAIDWKLVGQWVTILTAFVGILLINERRLSHVETAISEQMKGYTIVFAILTARLDRMETKIDHLNDRLIQP